MLGAKFSLPIRPQPQPGDVQDVEAFCERALSRSGITEFGYLDHDDLLAELVAYCWKISLDFDPARTDFDKFAGARLSTFIVDWKRSDFRTRWVFKDRVYERVKPTFVSYEEELARGSNDEVERRNLTPTFAGRRGLERPLTRSAMDPSTDRSPDLMRALRKGSGGSVRREDGLGEAPSRKAA